MSDRSLFDLWQLDQHKVQSWFAKAITALPVPITSSVDLRGCNARLIPVDTNLFPAGFNNLDPMIAKNAIAILKKSLQKYIENAPRIWLVAEEHTRNVFYQQSLAVLKSWLEALGCEVIISGVALEWQKIAAFNPGLIMLNHDLSLEIPDGLLTTEIPVLPNPLLGWASRRKSSHFDCYRSIVEKFAKEFSLDPWYFRAEHQLVKNIDFMAKVGLERLQDQVSVLLEKLKQDYLKRNWHETPYVVVKSDSGTYGMNIMIIKDANEISNLNRKQRTKMAVGKHGVPLHDVLLQEGIKTTITCHQNVCEPVIYGISGEVIGGFYRSHHLKNAQDNLNSPGMHFMPMYEDSENYHAYAMVAKLAFLAAGLETEQLLTHGIK